MLIYLTYVLLFTYLALPGLLLGDLVFRCPSCSAERLALCPKVTELCAEIVREPGCGCCPVCARQEGELCGVYSPRCSSGLRCYPSAESDTPLQQLIQGLGRCGQRVELEVTTVIEETNEVHGTENPLTKRPVVDALIWLELARKQNERRTKMKFNQLEEPQIPKMPQSACQQELDRVLEEISKMTSEDNRGPLENLYQLKFPNCDKHGLYNLKQCNMSTHGQRGECWCVDPLTGVQIPETPKVRGDPNCNQFHEELRVMPTATASL
ncbi:insulin-like growth factor-binding protein 2-B isoform X2 [Cheilinus undulatus]|uniref:insulin-like growth factor-binding protein 2-B isoform X2 n=1 Tax=Cheilinus undulatus TaxID=241271 RepID=UPI001BD47E14|nr:insulin-like growth factor-binding protein 2-B isoform X2 [Cheilinus undulatus]